MIKIQLNYIEIEGEIECMRGLVGDWDEKWGVFCKMGGSAEREADGVGRAWRKIEARILKQLKALIVGRYPHRSWIVVLFLVAPSLATRFNFFDRGKKILG